MLCDSSDWDVKLVMHEGTCQKVAQWSARC